MNWSPITRFHQMLTNNRWLKNIDTKDTVPEVRDILIGATLGTLIVVLLALMGIDGIVNGSFFSQPLVYLSSILLLMLGLYIFYLMVFSLSSRLRRLVQSKRSQQR